MKTEAEILENNYLLLNFVFNKSTPIELAKKIIELINSKERIVLDYGDTDTLESWGEVYDIQGRISYTKGSYGFKYPILLHNKRSIGGGLISTSSILSIKTSKGKKLIYELKK